MLVNCSKPGGTRVTDDFKGKNVVSGLTWSKHFDLSLFCMKGTITDNRVVYFIRSQKNRYPTADESKCGRTDHFAEAEFLLLLFLL